jgi:predicted metal-binding membrane protein
VQTRAAPVPRPVATTIVAALLACAVVAWVVTISQARSSGMGGMATMGAAVFLTTWLVMMVAMMFPSVAPMVLAFTSVTRARGEGYVPIAAFVLGYLMVWTAAGLVPLSVVQVINQAWMAPPSWLPRVGGAAVIIAGVYQFTPLKNVCLRACRTPLGFVMTHDFGRGLPHAVRAGASHGAYCLGCCWALMLVLAVIGLTNIAWMAGIAAIFFVEKNVRRGEWLPAFVGVACIIGGLTVAVWPFVLSGRQAM